MNSSDIESLSTGNDDLHALSGQPYHHELHRASRRLCLNPGWQVEINPYSDITRSLLPSRLDLLSLLRM